MIDRLKCLSPPLTSHRTVAPVRSVVGMVIAAADVYQIMPPTAITKFSLGLVSFISLLEQMKSTHMAVGKYHNTNSMSAAWNVHHLHCVYMYALPVQCIIYLSNKYNIIITVH